MRKVDTGLIPELIRATAQVSNLDVEFSIIFGMSKTEFQRIYNKATKQVQNYYENFQPNTDWKYSDLFAGFNLYAIEPLAVECFFPITFGDGFEYFPASVINPRITTLQLTGGNYYVDDYPKKTIRFRSCEFMMEGLIELYYSLRNSEEGGYRYEEDRYKVNWRS